MVTQATYDSGTVGSNTVWTTWISNSTSSSVEVSILEGTWQVWSGSASIGPANVDSSGHVVVNGYVNIPPREKTPEEIQEEEARALKWAAEREAERIRIEDEKNKREKAKARAKEFLLQLLDEKQKKDLEELHWFFVVDRLGRRWKIETTATGNLVQIDDNDKAIRRLCVVFKDNGPPVYDLMAAEKLTLETDPEEIDRVGILR